MNNNEEEPFAAEPMLIPSVKRFTLFPIQYDDLWAAYKQQESSFWTAEEIDYVADLNDWKKLDKDEQFFIENILAFFAGSDGVVLENLLSNFSNEVQWPEARAFYSAQGYIEQVHSQTYSQLIDTFITNPIRKTELFNAIENIPCVAKKTEWGLKWMNKNTRTFAERLVAFAAIEGIFFSGSFCAIFWLKNRGLMCKALGHSNELIARDEAMHCNFAITLYGHLNNKLSQEQIEQIFKEAVEIESEFIIESLPCKLIGINSDLMRDYIKYVADYWMVKFGYNKMYGTENPFSFMDLISLEGKTNFFEKKVSEYRKSYSVSNASEREIVLNSDF
jgi:ribonucleotide reductase beta subunit family protein with ferritin-like domain